MGLDLSYELLRRWALPAVLAAAALLIALAGDAGREALSLYRPAVHQGEFWRLVSGHLAHLGTSHLVLNLAGLALVWYLVSDYLAAGSWLIVTAVSVAGIDFGLWFFEPQLVWYVGLSGLLHGLLAAGVVAGLRSGRIEVWVLAVALVAKLAYEQFVGPLPGSEEASGGSVIVASHAWGALAGAVTAAILIRVRAVSPI
jgi:rhomboid family GlyGly-CTERM serine protease